MSSRRTPATVVTSFTEGVNTIGSEVEVSITPGLPSFDIIGLPDSSIKESRGRIRAAIQASEYKFPQGHITVSISPAYIKKGGSSFDLPVALGILIASDQLHTDKRLYAEGELSLKGDIRASPSAGLRLMWLDSSGVDYYSVIPEEERGQAEFTGYKGIFAADLKQACKAISDNVLPEICERRRGIDPESYNDIMDFSCVKGQEKAIRALLIAAAGKHSTLLLGSPGCGKTMAAELIRGIMPPLRDGEVNKVYTIREAAGLSPDNDARISYPSRPFRKIYPGISETAIFGSSNTMKPGEVTLASEGVLFADEVCEFSQGFLDRLRVPMEEHIIRLIKDGKTVVYPASFLFVGAGNPCRCGNLFETDKRCICNAAVRKRYTDKLSGPFMDRIDIYTEMRSVSEKDLKESAYGSDIDLSRSMREKVMKAWDMQSKRYDSGNVFNGTMLRVDSDLLRAPAEVIDHASKLAAKSGSSARGFNRILRVGRTIADVDGRADMRVSDISEAVMYRNSLKEGIKNG